MCSFFFVVRGLFNFSPHLYTFFALAGINNLHTMSPNYLGSVHQISYVQYILGLCVRIDFFAKSDLFTSAFQTIFLKLCYGRDVFKFFFNYLGVQIVPSIFLSCPFGLEKRRAVFFFFL